MRSDWKSITAAPYPPISASAPPLPPPIGAQPPPIRAQPPLIGAQPPLTGAQPPDTGFVTNFAADYGATGDAAFPSSPPIIAFPYPDMPPPSYNEAMGTGAALRDDDDNDHIRAEPFKPRYPVYTWN